MREIKVFPSILSADFTNLEKSIRQFDDAPVAGFHIDVMDGHFVPNITWGPWICETMGRITNKTLDVHLMIENSTLYIDKFARDNVEAITVHYEANLHIHRVIQQIRDSGKKAGISLNPGTPFYVIEDLLSEIDLVLVMTVNPGFGGQSFLDFTCKKIEALNEIREVEELDFEIYVDGGIGEKTAPIVKKAGATGLIAGNSVFSHPKPPEQVRNLIECE